MPIFHSFLDWCQLGTAFSSLRELWSHKTLRGCFRSHHPPEYLNSCYLISVLSLGLHNLSLNCIPSRPYSRSDVYIPPFLPSFVSMIRYGPYLARRLSFGQKKTLSSLSNIGRHENGKGVDARWEWEEALPTEFCMSYSAVAADFWLSCFNCSECDRA